MVNVQRNYYQNLEWKKEALITTLFILNVIIPKEK